MGSTFSVRTLSIDPAKNQRNIRDRGLSFDTAAEFDFEGALYAVDDRQDYGERRYVAVGLRGGRLHVLCFAETPDGTRVISFRKANPREVSMPRKKPLIDAKGEVRELTVDDLSAFGPARKALPESLKRKVGIRGRQKSPTKERITIRLSRTVVQRFRATGDGWQTRVDVALQDWLKKHNPAA